MLQLMIINHLIFLILRDSNLGLVDWLSAFCFVDVALGGHDVAADVAVARVRNDSFAVGHVDPDIAIVLFSFAN